MEKILRKIEKLIPKRVYKLVQPVYHYLLTLLGAIIYKFPARKIKVIGTKKETISDLLSCMAPLTVESCNQEVIF